MEHELYYGPDGIGSVDQFHYYFDLKLWDADTTKPVTARLQYGSMDGSGWQDCPQEGESVVNLTYSGTDSVWSGVMDYDMFTINLPAGEFGMIRQVRIACDYTLKDGTKGTVYSTDNKELYAYQGDYVIDNPDSEGYIGTFDGDELTASFRLIKDLLPDPSKVERTGMVVQFGEDVFDAELSQVSASSPDANGIFTVSCPASAFLKDGAEPVPGGNNIADVIFYYNDKNGSIDWECAAYGKIRIETSPYDKPAFTNIESERSYNPGIDEEYFDTHYYSFALDLKDADVSKPVTARLQYAELNSSSWTDCAKEGESTVQLTYSGSGNSWTSDHELKLDVLHYDLGGAIGMRKRVRIAVDYTLPDGKTGTVYSTDSGELFVYTGEFIEAISTNYENDVVTGTFRINRQLVADVSKLTLMQLTLYTSGGEHYIQREIDDKAEISAIAADGTFTITYSLTEETLSPEYKNGLIIVYVYNDYGGAIDGWRSSASAELEVP